MLRVGAPGAVALRFCRRSYARVRTTEVSTGFDAVWRTMSEDKKGAIIKEYAAIETQDWHTLTLDQKRAIYTIAYGPPAQVDPYEGYKVFGGVVACCSLGLGFFALARSKAKAPPKTLAPEYQRAQEEYLRSQNCDPIFGVSAKADKDAAVL